MECIYDDVLLQSYLTSKKENNATDNFRSDIFKLVLNQIEHVKTGMYLSKKAENTLQIQVFDNFFNTEKWRGYNPDKTIRPATIKTYYIEVIKRLITNKLINYYSKHN